MDNSLKNKAVKSVKWTTLTTLGNVLPQLVQMIILAHLLQPEDFGLMAMTMVGIRLLTPVQQAGLSQAIIQDQEINHDQLSTLYWANILLGVLAFILLAGAAPFMAGFFAEDRLVPITLWVAVSFLLLPIGAQFQALLSKELAFDKLSRIHISSYLAEFVFAVGSALLEAGVYALVIGHLARVVVNVILSLWYGLKLHRPKFIFRIREVQSQLRFGFFEAGNQLVNLASVQVDKLLIGRMLGAEALGLYTICWELIIMPLARINPVITRVAFPVYAKLQKDLPRLNRYYTKAVSLLMLINVPMLLGIALVSYEFLYLFYGPSWSVAATCLSILAFTGIAKAFGNPGGGILLALGRSDIGLYWNLFWTACIGAITWLFLRWEPSIEMAAWAQLAGAIGVTWIWHYLVARTGQLKYGPILLKVGKWLLLSVPMVVGVALLPQLFENTWWLFILKVVLGALLFGASVLLFARREWQEIKTLMQQAL